MVKAEGEALNGLLNIKKYNGKMLLVLADSNKVPTVLTNRLRMILASPIQKLIMYS